MNDLIGGEIIGIEVKFGNDSKKREVIGLGCWDNGVGLGKCWIGRN
nr:hypothetical protein [Staphylococcus epidermidis]